MGVRVGGLGGAIPGTIPSPSQDPYLVIFSLKAHTYGQMKAILMVLMRFPENGSRIDLELTRIDLRMTLPDTLPGWSPDALQMTLQMTLQI